LADYLPQNRLELSRWLKQESTFNWNSVLRIIATLEGLDGTKCKDMEVKTREKVS
jgi:hypothetical protein